MLATAIIERARQAGLDMVKVGDRIEARQGKKVLAFHTSGDQALKKAMERIEEARLRDLDKRPEDREPVLKMKPPLIEIVPDEAAPIKVIKGSIIKSKYKDRYKKNGYCNGDTFAEELRDYLLEVVNGRTRINTAKLREVATANGIDFTKYERLNVGQQRMNVGNRLRNLFRQGAEVNIGGGVFSQQFNDHGERLDKPGAVVAE